MAATIQIISHHGAAGATETQVDGGTMRYKVADNDTADANDPIPVPPSGTNYSYIKQNRFKCTVAPSNTVNNLKFYTDGANGLGTGVSIGAKTDASYTNPATQGTTQLSGTTDIFTYTSGSPLSVTGSTSGTGSFGDYVVSQMGVASTASPGTTPSETLTFQYDES